MGARTPQGSYGRDASGVHQGGLGQPSSRSGVAGGVGGSGGSSGGGKVGDYLMIYSVSFTVVSVLSVEGCGCVRSTALLEPLCLTKFR